MKTTVLRVTVPKTKKASMARNIRMRMKRVTSTETTSRILRISGKSSLTTLTTTTKVEISTKASLKTRRRALE